MQATYSPEDNKLRLYPASRLPQDVYARVRAAGFIWAAKQGLFVAPAWTPEREDLLTDLCGAVGDEDTSLVDRAEDRAERFEDYSDKREAEAHQAREAVDAIADGIPLGQPILVGHHSEKRARKDAERIESGMRKAVKLWETSQYWTARAAGAIRHAKYKELPAVRARRIKGLEADQRKHERSNEKSAACLKLWESCKDLRQARFIAGQTEAGWLPTAKHPTLDQYLHPSDVLPFEDRGDYAREHYPTWSLEQVQARARQVYTEAIERECRWIAHMENRLAYERAMMDESGGIAADKVKPEKGGGCRCWVARGGEWLIIKKVNKVSVTVEDNWGNGGKNFMRTVPFDKLSALMSKADVDTKRAAGLLQESQDGIGFYVKTEASPAPRVREPEAPTVLDDMADSLKAGVKVVSAPQLFPTPPKLARQMVELAEVEPGHRVLEPSAGTGRIVDALDDVPGAHVVAVEISATLADTLRLRSCTKHEVRCADFLECNGDLGTFDRIVMNPPFAGGQDIQHIQHARSMLKPGGRLVAICANGPRQREKLMPLTERWVDLPAGTFADEGTSVNAALLVIEEPEAIPASLF